MMLAISATGDAWNELLRDTSVQPPLCTGDGCGTELSFLYFLPFVVILLFILVNVLVAIVLEGVRCCALGGGDVAEFLEQYNALWSEYDESAERDGRRGRRGNGALTLAQFAQLAARLDGPYGKVLVQRAFEKKGISAAVEGNKDAAAKLCLCCTDDDGWGAALRGDGGDDAARRRFCMFVVWLDNAYWPSSKSSGNNKMDYHEGVQKLTALHAELKVPAEGSRAFRWADLSDHAQQHLSATRKVRAMRRASRLVRLPPTDAHPTPAFPPSCSQTSESEDQRCDLTSLESQRRQSWQRASPSALEGVTQRLSFSTPGPPPP